MNGLNCRRRFVNRFVQFKDELKRMVGQLEINWKMALNLSMISFITNISTPRWTSPHRPPSGFCFLGGGNAC